MHRVVNRRSHSPTKNLIWVVNRGLTQPNPVAIVKSHRA